MDISNENSVLQVNLLGLLLLPLFHPLELHHPDAVRHLVDRHVPGQLTCGGFFGNHFYIVHPASQFDRERLRQKFLTPQLGYFPKKRGLFVCFGFLIKSRTDCRFPYLVTLSPQNSVITVCPVTPSTFVHIIVNFCTYQLQLFYISIKTILSYFNHCTM